MTMKSLALVLLSLAATTASAQAPIDAGPGPASADSADPLARQLAELRRMNEALAAKVERLERNQAAEGTWLTEARAAEIRGLVQDTLADAGTRASMADDGATAGWDRGFFLASADGSFRLMIGGQIQARWAYGHRETSANLEPGPDWAGLGAENNWGWEIRRAQIAFTGHIIDPSWTYEFQPTFNRNGRGGGGTIQNMFIRKTEDFLGGTVSVRAGQFKPPYNREENISSQRQLAVERTIVSETFTPKFSQGIELVQTWSALRLSGFYGDRMRADHTIPTDGLFEAANIPDSMNTSAFAVPQVDYALAGRVDVKLAGSWKQSDDLNSYPDTDLGLTLGAAVMAQNYRGIPAEERFGGVTYFNPSSMWGLTADAKFDLGGFNVFSSAFYRNVRLAEAQTVRGGGTGDEMDQWGFTIQGGIFVTDTLQPFVRWEVGSLDTDQFRTLDDAALAVTGQQVSIVTAGVNWMIEGSRNRNLALTADFGYAFVPIVDFAQNGAQWQAELLPEPGDNYASGQMVARVQLKLIF